MRGRRLLAITATVAFVGLAAHRAPADESAETWITIPAEMDERDISTEPGIADIQSGAEGTSANGSAYADW